MREDKYISLTFDDGWKSAIEGADPLLLKHGMPGTFYVITSMLGKEHTLYMDQTDINVLHRHGHEIGSHTRSHLHLVGLPSEKAYFEIKQGKNDLRHMGFFPKTFAYPYGEWGPNTVKFVREAEFEAARTTTRGYNDEHIHPLLLKAFGVKMEDSHLLVRAWIKNFLESDGSWMILFFHQIEPIEVLKEKEWIYGTTPEVLGDTLNYIEKEKVTVLTVAEGIKKIRRTA